MSAAMTDQRNSEPSPAEPAPNSLSANRRNSQEISVLGVNATYYRAGEGAATPLVLLHGGGLDSAWTTWGPTLDELGDAGPVIAPDLPGFGSTPLAMTAPSIREYSKWVLALLDQMGVQRCVLVGLSLGGAIAIQVALASPDRVLGLGLLAPYGISARTPGGRAGWVVVHSPGVNAATNLVLRHSRTAVRRSLATLLHRPGTLTEALVDEVSALLSAPQAGRAWQRVQQDEVRWSGPATDLRTSIRSLTCPVVFLVGEHDLVPPEDVQAAAAAVPNARFLLVEGAGHWLTRDAPAEVTAELTKLRDEAARLDGAGPQ